MYDESDLLPISALQHLAFCPRQCALIHIERAWEENRFTAEGRILHEKTHEADTESRGDLRIARGLKIRSLRLGLSGQTDVVEFHRTENDTGGIRLPDTVGLWQAFPVEYKRGKPKLDDCDLVQLCAQAMCLEEMLNTAIPTGALYYGKPHRRMDVAFDGSLRSRTEALADELHALIRSGITPVAEYEKKCMSCSLLDICMPRRPDKNVQDYIRDNISKD